MKKILILLFACTLTMQAAFAVRPASLTRFLESESANRLIARISPEKLSPQRVANFTPAQKEAILESGLPQKEGASLMERILDMTGEEVTAVTPEEKRGILDILRPAPGTANYSLYKIRDGLELALTDGDVDAYRENMVTLLNTPYRHVHGMGLVNILPQNFGERMYKHGDRSFRRELYDLLNTLANRQLVELPEEHKSIYYWWQDSPWYLVFENTDLGFAVRMNDVEEFFEISREIMSEGTFKEVLAHLNARVWGRTKRSSIKEFMREKMAPISFELLKSWEADSREEMISTEIQMEIMKWDPEKTPLEPLMIASGSIAGLALGAYTGVQYIPDFMMVGGALGGTLGMSIGAMVSVVGILSAYSLRQAILEESLTKGFDLPSMPASSVAPNQQDR